MYCKNCGNKLNVGDKYCNGCGNDIKENNNVNRTFKETSSPNISLIFGIIACCLFFVPFISIPLAIVAIITGITNRKNQKSTGTVLGIISITLTIGMYILIFSFFKLIIKDMKPLIENSFEELIKEEIEISVNTFIASDNSIIEFSNNGNYYWYTNKENNYNKGNYTLYKNLEAYNYAKSNLNNFNYYNYDIDDFYLIIMNPTEIMVDGIIVNDTNTVYYYGEYESDEETLELYNHNTKKEFKLTLYNNYTLDNIDI